MTTTQRTRIPIQRENIDKKKLYSLKGTECEWCWTKTRPETNRKLMQMNISLLLLFCVCVCVFFSSNFTLNLIDFILYIFQSKLKQMSSSCYSLYSLLFHFFCHTYIFARMTNENTFQVRWHAKMTDILFISPHTHTHCTRNVYNDENNKGDIIVSLSLCVVKKFLAAWDGQETTENEMNSQI